MSIPSLADLLAMDISDGFSDEPVPVGEYNAVITGCDVRKGQKGPYLAIETTIFDGEHQRRKVWRNSSFSDKAVGMPGGIAQLLQTTTPDIAKDLPANEIPAAIAQAVLSVPVIIEVEHDQVVRNGVKQTKADGQPELRAQVRSFIAATPELLDSFEAGPSRVDEDLPF